MTFIKKILRFLLYLGIILLQLIMTQVVTFLGTLLLPYTEDFPHTQPIVFAIFLGITFSVGVFLTGWLAIQFHWLQLPHKYPTRLAGTLLGAYLPLVAALIIYRTLEAGNPFFLMSILGSILGFYILGWEEKK